MSNQLEEHLHKATQLIEKQVDAAIERLDNLDVNDLENLRKQRLKELRDLESKKREWLSNGHGEYDELAEEKRFFDIIKKSENVVVHFYTNTNSRCPIVDKHLKILAPKHLETRFTKINAEKCPFLAEKLKIKTIPTIVLVHNSIMVDKIVGFTQLGNRDDFTTEILEWRIAQSNIIRYEGDLATPPDQKTDKKKSENPSGRKIRDSAYNREDDDLDIDDYEPSLSQGQNLECKKGNPALATELTPEEAAELGLND